MDAIFGLGAKAEIFSPENGLFLDEEIEKALDHRYCTGC
jgi:HNH endonuclease